MHKKKYFDILIVDDQKNWCDVISTMLINEGFSVIAINNFNSAKNLLQELRFNLAILDIRLEDKDIYNIQGIELLKLIKTRNYKVKVVVLTGYQESIKEGILKKYNTEALFKKAEIGLPLNTKRFISKIRELLK